MLTRMKQSWITARGVWSDRPLVDWLFVAILVGVHAALVCWADAGQIADLAKDDRMRIYTTLASVSALLFGFATASIAFFYGSATGDRVDLMKKVLSAQLVSAWRASLSAPLVAVGVCVGAIAGDARSDGRPWVQWAVEVAIVLLAVRAFRLRWLFIKTLALMALDSSSPNSYAPGTSSLVATPSPRRRSSEG
jgi:hypothetical protein